MYQVIKSCKKYQILHEISILFIITDTIHKIWHKNVNEINFVRQHGAFALFIIGMRLEFNFFNLSARSQLQEWFNRNTDQTSQRSPSDSAVVKHRGKLARDGGTGSE